MKQFTYTITDPVGIHARPAGVLAKQAKALDSTVTIAKADGKSAAATKLMASRITCKRRTKGASALRQTPLIMFLCYLHGEYQKIL